MSKELNGAELLQLIIDGKIKYGDKIERIDRLEIYVYRADARYLVDENGIEVASSRLLAGKFRVLEKPVSFMEAIEAYYNGKSIKCIINGDEMEYTNDYDETLDYNVIIDNFNDGITVEEILKGKWYIC